MLTHIREYSFEILRRFDIGSKDHFPVLFCIRSLTSERGIRIDSNLGKRICSSINCSSFIIKIYGVWYNSPSQKVSML